jgi:phage/plasmid primase-like uncharacterized protein
MIASLQEIDRARTTPIESILDAHGVRLRGHVERIGPCPGRGGSDRFAVNARKGLFLCRGCGARGDAIALEQFLSGVNFGTAVGTLAGGASRPSGPTSHISDAAQRASKALDSATTTNDALALWNASGDPRGTVVEKYLRRRGLELDDDVATEALRFHSGICAMIALFRDIASDEMHAVSRTFLDRDGNKIGRKFLGPVGGCAIKLDPDDAVVGGLHIGEGVETCLAARQLGLRPAWALGSAGAIASFPVLNGIEALTILQEHDAASARAVEQCAARWHAAGREVLINEPIGGKDLNDRVEHDCESALVDSDALYHLVDHP